MSLWDKTPCASCGHPRHWHKTIDTKQGRTMVGCRRCDCRRFEDPFEEAR